LLDKASQKKATYEDRITLTDEELIARFQDGDVYAFDQIVYRFKDPLINFVYNFLGNRVDSEDVVQETFLRVYKNKHLYRRIAKFSTWIYTIASNLAKTELRKRRRRRLLSISQMGFEDKDYDLTDTMLTPDQKVQSDMNEKIIRDEIDSLPVKFKEVIVLRDIQQLSYEEISQILNIPIGTVKSRVNRGRSRLQKNLKHLWKK
jgi:RNA polymerase sigma-70 factor (ECF subfamily)